MLIQFSEMHGAGSVNPLGQCIFRVNNKDTRATSWGVFIANFEQVFAHKVQLKNRSVVYG